MEDINKLVITPLGTVSPYCKGEKNCPGFLIEYKERKILLDCGEGVSRLMNFEKDLNDLIVIISHLHKDHYSGLSSLAYGSYCYHNLGFLQDKIKVYIPKGDFVQIREDYKNNDELGASKTVDKEMFDFLYLMNYGKENYLDFIPYNDKDIIIEDDLKITFASNVHPIKTFSVKVSNGSESIVYSADTGYNNSCLVKFAKNADLFICESTFLRGQNRKKDEHLYAYEAGMVAKDAGVKQLMLTHFWPEIDKMRYVLEAQEVFKNTIAAEEGKRMVLHK